MADLLVLGEAARRSRPVKLVLPSPGQSTRKMQWATSDPAALAPRLRLLADQIQAGAVSAARVVGELESLRVEIELTTQGEQLASTLRTIVPLPAPEEPPIPQEVAAARFAIPLRTLRRLTRCGLIPSVRLGKARLVRPSDIDRYLRRCADQGVRVGTRLDR